jgi:hypothetical protein
MSYGMDSQDSVPGKGKIISLAHNFPTSSKAHTVSFPVGTGVSFFWE